MDTGKLETDKMEDKVVVKGDISEDVTPFNYNTTADKYLLDLCYASLRKAVLLSGFFNFFTIFFLTDVIFLVPYLYSCIPATGSADIPPSAV